MVEIYNVCNWPGRMHRPSYSTPNTWIVPAAERGGPPTRLVIHDAYQLYRRLSTDAQTPATILAYQIADDFLNENVRNAPHVDEYARPGMWQHNPLIPLEEEIEDNLERFRQYCLRWVDEADQMYARRKAGHPDAARPTERHRQCAQYLLYTREWVNDIRPNMLKQCDNCGEAIGASLKTCPQCKFVVDPVGLEKLKAEKRAEVLAYNAALKAQAQAQAAAEAEAS